jgi:hypothetical protein
MQARPSFYPDESRTAYPDESRTGVAGSAYTREAMNRFVLPLAAVVAVLVNVGPALALSGSGVTTKLTAPRVSTVADGKTETKTHTCQAGDTRDRTKAHSAVVGTARKTAVVACEQPPRSQVLGPGLKQSAANVLAALG